MTQRDALDVVIFSPGLPHDGNTLKARSLGGSETAAIHIARSLAKRGNFVTAFSTCEKATAIDGVQWRPIGEFAQYVCTIPHDVTLVSRDTGVLPLPMRSKLCALWVHDLALKRGRNAIAGSLWRLDQIVTVSDYQRRQYQEVLEGMPDTQFLVARNGVDREAIAAATKGISRVPIKLLYGSRPERGLEAALNVMQILAERGSPLVLGVAGYDNTVEQMRPYYEALWARCRQMPNVQLLGPLKQADWWKQIASAQAVLYPGCPGDFREVSCIIAMEAMACGTPFVTIDKGAIAETMGVAQTTGASAYPGILVGNEESEPFHRSYAEEFATKVQDLCGNPIEWKRMSDAGSARAAQLDWQGAADLMEESWRTTLRDRTSNPFRLRRHLERTGDREALTALFPPKP